MDLDNRTPFAIAWLPGRMRYPAHSLTVIVKGTFDLLPGETAGVSEDQFPVEAETPFPGDDGEEASLYYDTDLVHFKPRADRLLVGTCHAPRGRKVSESTVTFKVGRWSRALRVVGDRHWERCFITTKPSKPRPFKSVPLRYENAYGGPGFAANPVGAGYVFKSRFKGSDPVSLPNLEDPQSPVKSPTDKAGAVGFGPISRTWTPRVDLVGTYGDRWLETRCPWFPEDLDWAAFNAAPETSQADRYLRGDEPVVLENMHAEHERVESRLPSTVVRCFVGRDPEPGRESFEELEMNLDTLWIDTDRLKLVLVWRGVCRVESQEFEDLVSLHVVSEDLGDAPGHVEDYRRDLVPLPSAVSADVEPAPTEAEDSPRVWTPAEVLAAVRQGESLAETQLAGLDLTEADLKTADLRGAILTGTILRGADLTDARLDDTVAAEVDMEDADLTGVSASGANLTDARLAGARGSNVVLSGAVLDGADLTGSELDGADLSRASLRGATLSEASLVGSSLWKADLEGAAARRVNLFSAVLGCASLIRADLRGANLFAADLADTELDGARLEGANLKRTRLQGKAK